jgi:hypothetical protein
MLAGGDFAFLARLLDHHGMSSPMTSDKTGGVNGHDIRVVDREDVGHGLRQVGQAAEHGRAFGEGTGRGHRPVP